jgi:hypothetical protein
VNFILKYFEQVMALQYLNVVEKYNTVKDKIISFNIVSFKFCFKSQSDLTVKSYICEALYIVAHLNGGQ